MVDHGLVTYFASGEVALYHRTIMGTRMPFIELTFSFRSGSLEVMFVSSIVAGENENCIFTKPSSSSFRLSLPTPSSMLSTSPNAGCGFCPMCASLHLELSVPTKITVFSVTRSGRMFLMYFSTRSALPFKTNGGEHSG